MQLFLLKSEFSVYNSPKDKSRGIRKLHLVGNIQTKKTTHLLFLQNTFHIYTANSCYDHICFDGMWRVCKKSCFIYWSQQWFEHGYKSFRIQFSTNKKFPFLHKKTHPVEIFSHSIKTNVIGFFSKKPARKNLLLQIEIDWAKMKMCFHYFKLFPSLEHRHYTS